MKDLIYWRKLVYLINWSWSVFFNLVKSKNVDPHPKLFFLRLHFITEILNPPRHFSFLNGWMNDFLVHPFTAHLPSWFTKDLPRIPFWSSITPRVPFCVRCIESGGFALAGIQWPRPERRRSDVSPHSARNRRLSLFSRHCGMLRCAIHLSPTNRCRGRMNCWELSPEIGMTATECAWVCEGWIVCKCTRSGA